jgi:hypothetical protein
MRAHVSLTLEITGEETDLDRTTVDAMEERPIDLECDSAPKTLFRSHRPSPQRSCSEHRTNPAHAGGRSICMAAQESIAVRLWAAFHDGGWMMWFILLFGLLAATAAGRFALKGERQLVGFIRWMIATTLVSGLFGFLIGMTKVLHFVVAQAKPADRSVILLLGTREAMSTLNAAFMLATIGCLLVAIGHRRYPEPNPSAVPR